LHKESSNGGALYQKIGEEMKWEMMELPAWTNKADDIDPKFDLDGITTVQLNQENITLTRRSNAIQQGNKYLQLTAAYNRLDKKIKRYHCHEY